MSIPLYSRSTIWAKVQCHFKSQTTFHTSYTLCHVPCCLCSNATVLYLWISASVVHVAYRFTTLEHFNVRRCYQLQHLFANGRQIAWVHYDSKLNDRSGVHCVTHNCLMQLQSWGKHFLEHCSRSKPRMR